MKTFVLAFDSTMIMPSNYYYIWYKGLYMKYIKRINPHTGKQDFSHTDSILSISDEEDSNVWLKMSEFARAWAYANNVKIRVSPGITVCPAFLSQIKKALNTYGDFRTLSMYNGIMKGAEFVRISLVDSPEKADLLRLYTMADANPEIYFKILFFWHTIVYPSKNDIVAVNYINKIFPLLHIEQTSNNILFDGTFGIIENNNIGQYVQKRIRNALAHIKRNDGISLILEDNKQMKHLGVIANILKNIAKYKLDNDYNLNQNAPTSVCRLYNPDIEFNQQDSDI